MKPIVVAVTGASGAVYARRLIEVLLAQRRPVQFLISPTGAQVWEHELEHPIGLDPFDPATLQLAVDPRNLDCLDYYANDDYFSPVASGGAESDGMVIVPCSGDTLSAVAHGAASNLIRRAAEVQLKERRKLILVPREAPLSLVAIDNMKRVTEAGAVVLPASPGWYNNVRSLDDLVDFIVARIMTQLGLPQRLVPNWGDNARVVYDP